MEIYVGNLPRYAAASHLNRFFVGFGRVAHFRVQEKVMVDGVPVRFALGVIEPDIAARRAISALNGKRLLGSPLVLRPYIARSGQDRRRPTTRRNIAELRSGTERRLIDHFRPAKARGR